MAPSESSANSPNNRSSEPVFRPRVTVAVVVEQQGRYLLVEELIRGKRVFNQPAGHLDPGESLIEAACRETLEETACEVDPFALVGVYQLDVRDRHFVRFTFAATLRKQHADRALDHGILRAVWMDREEIAASKRLRSSMVLRSIDDYLSGRRIGLDLLARL